MKEQEYVFDFECLFAQPRILCLVKLLVDHFFKVPVCVVLPSRLVGCFFDLLFLYEGRLIYIVKCQKVIVQFVFLLLKVLF